MASAMPRWKYAKARYQASRTVHFVLRLGMLSDTLDEAVY